VLEHDVDISQADLQTKRTGTINRQSHTE